MDNAANILANLRGAVTLKLVTEHEFTIEDAETAVEKSVVEDSDMWSENAVAEDLAKYLASDDDDE